MSKDNNLRLLGSPVNLTYRGKKKEDRKNPRNRPRSALQNSCFTPDIPEKYKRPFSADAKEQASSTRSFLKSFSAELLQSYHISSGNVKVVPPTTELLASKSSEKQTFKTDKDLCSNASDYGSEDTYISLGTKIKDKAQATTKTRNSNQKNFLKYRSIARRGRKNMDSNTHQQDKGDANNYGLEVKIIEKVPRPLRSPSPPRRNYFDHHDRSLSPALTVTPYESYFVPLDCETKESLAGRVSFGTQNSHPDVELAIDTYSRRLNMTKQQLSLVEEESTQDLESIRSHNNKNSRQNSKEDLNANSNADVVRGRNTYITDKDNAYSKNTINNEGPPISYGSFYDDFRPNTADTYKMSCTVIHTDSSSKDSGYPDSAANDEKSYRQKYSFPPSCLKKSYSHDKLEQPKSLDSAPTDSNNKNFYIEKKNTWAEPLNHSRLLYKDFFLKKEGHIAVPPNNSPILSKDSQNVPGCSQATQNNENEYPSYLLNSTTKAYTSKVIEDYKKELEAINNLHELTIKDMQTDAISPTPLNIDKLFDEHSLQFENDIEKLSNSLESSVEEDLAKVNENTFNTEVGDISKVSTKELIHNYLKVKDGDYPKNAKKFEKKVSNVSTKDTKQEWNNKNPKSPNKTTIVPHTINNNSTRNVFTLRAPLSARIEGVQNDKDIDSWMSLSAPSPIILESDTEYIDTPKIIPEVTQPIQEKPKTPESKPESEAGKPKELNPGSTVLDIYSMLKEIESYGDNPVTAISKLPEVEDKSTEQSDAKSPSPRDNFMEIFKFLEKVEQSANDALSVVTNTTQQTTPKLEVLLKLPQTELAQQLVTASLQLEERSCCIALLQESLTNHKEQMINKVSNLERQSYRNISRVKQECEEAIKRHQNFIDQVQKDISRHLHKLINDKKTLNHRIEQLVEERRSLEERWKRSAQALEDRYKLQLKNQHDKMAAAQQVARQRWVRQKAEKIKELTVKGLEGELREMAERQQKEIADLKMSHAEQTGRIQAKHVHEMEQLRRGLEEEKEMALVKERQLASSRLEKQILELELTYQEQRTRIVAEMRAENERVANSLCERERDQRLETEKWREDQERILEEKRRQLDTDIAMEKEKIEEQMKQKQQELEQKFEQYKLDYESEQQMAMKRKVTEISNHHKIERDREIEKAIESMEAEAQAGRKELQEALRRNKEQYELELKELAQTEQATLRRYQDSQARIRNTEDKCAEMEITISQLETRNRVLTEKSLQLEVRAEEIRASCEEAWRNKVDALVKEAEDTKKTHDEQMHQLYAKVKVAVARKDSAIQALTREAGKYKEKITLLEQKLQQQRKDFLAKK